MESCTMSRAFSASRTANSACLYARRSTLARNSVSSFREARRASFFVGRNDLGRCGPMVSKAAFRRRMEQGVVVLFEMAELANPIDFWYSQWMPKASSKAPKRLHRPRDPLALAKLIGDIATGQAQDHQTSPLPEPT